jgi:phenylacetate-CoA ligase
LGESSLKISESYFNRKFETLDPRDLRDLQERRFRETIHASSQSPLYAQAFAKMGFRPDDIRTIDDLRKKRFFTTKEDLRLGFPFGALAIDRNKVAEIHATSGTTGTPTLGLHSSKDLDDWGEISARSLVMAGCTKDDIFQITPSLGMFSGGYGFYHGARKVGCTIVPASAGFSRRQIQYMMELNTTMFSAIVSYAFRLAEVAKEEGIDVRKETRVRKGIFGSEIWTRETKRRIANLWDLDPFDIYGFTELYGPGVGNDCKYHDGIHIWQDYFLVEVVDPKTGEPVGAEEEGELVFTTLAKEAMPLIRYRSRDLSFLFDSQTCDCGRTHRRYKEIRGRTDDMIKVSGVNFWPSEIETILLGEPDLGHEYKITISRKESLDRMAIEVESKERIQDLSKINLLTRKLADDIRNVTMLSPEIRIVEPNSLPRVEVGKAKRVYDERS